ncbi:hypothetical protein FQN52_005862, partial [Onygenales sp. PD_12]
NFLKDNHCNHSKSYLPDWDLNNLINNLMHQKTIVNTGKEKGLNAGSKKDNKKNNIKDDKKNEKTDSSHKNEWKYFYYNKTKHIKSKCKFKNHKN